MDNCKSCAQLTQQGDEWICWFWNKPITELTKAECHNAEQEEKD